MHLQYSRTCCRWPALTLLLTCLVLLFPGCRKRVVKVPLPITIVEPAQPPSPPLPSELVPEPPPVLLATAIDLGRTPWFLIPTPSPPASPPPGETTKQPVVTTGQESGRPSPFGTREPAAAIPVLRPILTDEQKAEYLQATNESLKRARENLALLKKQPPRTLEVEDLRRIEEFIRLAEESRSVDPIRAYELARRAEVLSQDLMRRAR